MHLLPFFGQLGLSEVTPGKVQDYRMHRITTSKTGAAPARSTMYDEIVTLCEVLKTAIGHGWLAHLPDLSRPSKTRGKIVYRSSSMVQLRRSIISFIRRPHLCEESASAAVPLERRAGAMMGRQGEPT